MNPKEQSAILQLFTFVTGALTLNALWQNRYMEVMLPSEARREGYDDLITQTGI